MKKIPIKLNRTIFAGAVTAFLMIGNAQASSDMHQLYEDNCARGQGADHVPFLGEAQLFEWITDGIPSDGTPLRMPSFATALSDEERADVVNFLKATWTFGFYDPVRPDDLQ